jgi:hypothetical protein
MHRKYAAQGLVALSVSLDEEPKKKEVQAEVLKFLQEQKATFTNVVLDEEFEAYNARLGIVAPPHVIVFNRRGEWQKLDSDALAGDKGEGETRLEKLVVELLKQ